MAGALLTVFIVISIALILHRLESGSGDVQTNLSGMEDGSCSSCWCESLTAWAPYSCRTWTRPASDL